MNTRYENHELKACFYYPACGFDLQPLLRFSHLTDFFVFADPQYSENTLDNEFGKVLKQSPFDGALKLSGEPVFVSENELGGRMAPPGHLAHELLAQEAELHQALRHRCHSFAREYSFDRIIDGQTRPLRLLYVAGAAMATYHALFGAREINPTFLCTIQSHTFGRDNPHALEAATGVHKDFLTHFGGPRFWLRGSRVPEGDRTPEHIAARAEGAWNHVVQLYTGWECYEVVPQFTGFAHVTAFSRQDDDLNLDAHRMIVGEMGRTIQLEQGEVTLMDLERFDAAFLDPRTAERLQRSQTPVYVHGGGTLAEELARIEQIATENDYRRIVMTGCGYEDEGSYLHRWASGAGLPVEVELRFVNDLDLADQRGWGRH